MKHTEIIFVFAKFALCIELGRCLIGANVNNRSVVSFFVEFRNVWVCRLVYIKENGSKHD